MEHVAEFLSTFEQDRRLDETPIGSLSPYYVDALLSQERADRMDFSVVSNLRETFSPSTTELQTKTMFYAPYGIPYVVDVEGHLRDAENEELTSFRRMVHLDVAASQVWQRFGPVNRFLRLPEDKYFTVDVPRYMSLHRKAGGM